MTKKYVPLHAHNSMGSIGDALLKLKEYSAKAKDYGLPAIALTDHGTLTSMYAFNECCSGEGVRPIFGCEVYEVNDRLMRSDENNLRNHLVLLAKNKKGLENLLSIVNDAFLNGFYYKPRTDRNFMKEHGEGIICLSACVGGRVPQAILNYASDEDIIEMINEYKDIFDEYYLEIQPGKFDEQLRVNAELVRFSSLTRVPLVVTNDIHYLEEDDCVLHDAHVKIARKQRLEDPQVYPDDCYWFMDYDTVFNMFEDTIDHDILAEAIENTVRIADQCHVQLDKDIYLPKFTENNPTNVLSQKCFNRLEDISDTLSDPSKYMSRLLYELDTIEKLGFVDYFLMVEDFLNYARSGGIAVGPGRGSVGGSLVAFLLNICVADPVKYNLLFERFLSVHRPGLPDIDLDFDSSRREEMFQYAIEKYGAEHCALVSTFMMRKSRTAIRDVARILEIDTDLSDHAAKLIPTVYYDDDGEKMTDLSIDESLQVVPELQELYEEYPRLFDTASRISDVPFTTSIHAAGMLISPRPLGEFVPLIPTKKGINATALSLNDAELAGVVKMDFLGLASLSVYENTQKDVGFTVDLTRVNFDDEKVWNLIGSKYTTGLFQISSKTYKSRMPRLKPKSIQELAHCLALLRGPCISSGADKDYMDILEGKKEPDFIHEAYYTVTKDTQGILLYQEQIMQLAVEFGFTLEEGYKLMKGVSKKKMEIIKAWRDQFIDKALEHHATHEQAERMWHMIEVSGQYSFNQAHAISYALLSFVSAYLKIHYPKEFLKNLLTNAFNRDKKEEILEALEDCRRYGFKFLPPDANKSSWEFTLEGDYIRMGLCAIKGFGEKAAEEVIAHRPFTSFNDFMARIAKNKCGKRAMIPAIFSNVFSEFGEPLEIYQQFCELRREEPQDVIRLQSKETFDPTDDLSKIEPLLITGNFTTDPSNTMPSFGFRKLREKSSFEANAVIMQVKKHKDKNGKQMAFVTLMTGDGHLEGTVFPSTLSSYSKLIRKNSRIQFSARKDGEFSCVINKVSA